MKVKTITAATIHAALQEARRMFGEDVVLLESVPPQDGELARITVMAEGAPRRPVAPRQATPRPAPPAPRPRTAEPSTALANAALGFGYGSGGHGEAVLAEEPALATEGVSRFAAAGGDGRAAAGSGRNDDASYEPSVEARRLWNHDQAAAEQRAPARAVPGRGQLFPTQAETIQGTPALPHQQSLESIEQLLQAQLQLVQERLQLIERRFDDAIIGSAHRWLAHPLFAALLDQGLRPTTLTKLFDSLAANGYGPEAETETIKWALAQEMRRLLNTSAPKHTNGAQLFIGPSGAGKTSLVLKLAKHTGFYARRKTAVIAILPEDDEVFFQSPVDLFRSHGLAVQTVRSVEDMRNAILRVQHFDQILIDTPPMPAPEAAARKQLVYIKRLVDPIMPLQVQLVLNATRTLEDFDAATVQRLPLRPDRLAVTHLDEAMGWGRVAEWLMALQMPVQFASTSPRVPDGVLAFSPTWFIEEMLKL